MKASERGKKRVHPTQKPVALAEWVIETAAPEAKLVIDLFLGSGSGLIAAERKNIKCFGMELAEPYCDVVNLEMANSYGECRCPGRHGGHVRGDQGGAGQDRSAGEAAHARPGGPAIAHPGDGMMRLVIIESPFSASDPRDQIRKRGLRAGGYAG